jgi:hypothetical protein
MIQHSINFYENVTVEIHFRNVFKKDYYNVIDYLSQANPTLTVTGKVEAEETEWSRLNSRIVGYTQLSIEPVVTIRFRDDAGEMVVADVRSRDKETLLAVVFAGYKSAIIDSYEVSGNDSKTFAHLTFRKMR